MASQNVAFTGSVPENYDQYLGPHLFEPYAKDIVSRLGAIDNGAVLEIACGTGIVTKQLRDRLPATTRLVATDSNQAMIDFARGKLGPEPAIEWKPADAMELPFLDETFDAVVCQFGIMFVPDKQQAFAEARRALKPGGRFLFNTWDSMEHNMSARITHTTIASFFKEDPPNFYETPFGFHDGDAITSMLQQAGFADVKVEVVKLPAESPSAAELSNGLVKGTPVIGVINERRPSELENIRKAVADAVAKEMGDPVRGTMQALVIEATK